MARQGGKQYNTHNKIAEDIEEATRFVSEVLGYSPADVWKMNCYEFWRDFLRAKQRSESQLKQMEKWRNK